MKVIYNYYDETSYLLFDDDEPWPEGDWTEVAPPPGLYEPYYFDGEKWIGTSKEVYEENNPPEPYNPTDVEKDVSNIIKTLYTMNNEDDIVSIETIQRYFDKNCYTKSDISDYVKNKVLTPEQYKGITGEYYKEPQAK